MHGGRPKMWEPDLRHLSVARHETVRATCLWIKRHCGLNRYFFNPPRGLYAVSIRNELPRVWWQRWLEDRRGCGTQARQTHSALYARRFGAALLADARFAQARAAPASQSPLSVYDACQTASSRACRRLAKCRKSSCLLRTRSALLRRTLEIIT